MQAKISDERPEAAAQFQLREMAKQSAQASQLRGWQAKVSGSRQSQPLSQLQRLVNTSSQPAPVQLVTRVRAEYNWRDGEGKAQAGALDGTLQSIASRDAGFFSTFPAEAYVAIVTALDALDPNTFEAHDLGYIQQIKRLARNCGRSRIVYASGDNESTATLNGEKISEVEYEEENDKYWISGLDTKERWRRLGIATKLINEAAKHLGGTLYASTRSKQEHEDIDDQDTRWLTADGSALVNAVIASGSKVEYADPFAHGGGDNSDDDY